MGEKILVIGSGYVGLTTGACLAELGNYIVCIDNNEEKISALKNGIMPIYEPGLEPLVKRNLAEGRLSFATEIKEAVENATIIFICVGTPPKENGEPDLSAMETVVKDIAKYAREYKLIVEKSTVPVQTASWLKGLIKEYIQTEFDIAVNPEFLREGSAIKDFMSPDRIVIGTESSKAAALLSELYKPLNAPILHTDINSAELIKHLSNAMLAQRISTINLIAQLCEKAHADIETVARGVGLDKRIGQDFLKAGIGYGGFCFPKDLDALIHIIQKNEINPSLFEAVRSINNLAQNSFVKKIEKGLESISGKTLAVLGLSFKPNTDDMRFAPSVRIIRLLQERGARIRAYDPKAMGNAKEILSDVEFCKDAYSAAEGADCLLILTEWQEFLDMDLQRIKSLLKEPIIFDGRNIFNKERMNNLGFEYFSIGR